MAASDYVPILFKNRLHLAGRPQMGSSVSEVRRRGQFGCPGADIVSQIDHVRKVPIRTFDNCLGRRISADNGGKETVCCAKHRPSE
jgi:hypothetical protein